MGWIDLTSLPRGRWTKSLLLTFLAAGFAVALGEIVLRLFLPLHFVSSNFAYRYDPQLGYVAKPGHTLVLKDYQQEMYVNQLGTINFQEDFKDYESLVFALGDSYTQGTGLYADASYPFQLDLLLNVDREGNYRKKYAIVNLGLSAFGGEQSFIALQRYLQKIGKPKMVLYLGCENDFLDDLAFKSGHAHRAIVEGNPFWGWLYHPVKWIFVDTEIGKRIKFSIAGQRVKSNRESIQVASAHTAEKLQKEAEAPLAAAVEIDVLERIAQISQANGARVILSWANPTPSYRYLRDWARKSGYVFADWAPSVQSVQNAIPGLPTGNPHSGGHYRTWVNQLIAREYARQIKMIFPEGNGGR